MGGTALSKETETGSWWRRLARLAFFILGGVSLGLGLIGLFVPGLPTTVFLLLAAWAWARSSPRWHLALLNHPRLGPPIQSWQRHRCLSRRSKRNAVLSILVSYCISAYALSDSPLLVIALGLFLTGLIGYLLSRPTCPVANGTGAD